MKLEIIGDDLDYEGLVASSRTSIVKSSSVFPCESKHTSYFIEKVRKGLYDILKLSTDPDHTSDLKNEFTGRALILNIPFSKTHSHIFIDVLPKLLHLYESNEYDQIYVPHSEILVELMELIKIDMSDKVTFVKGKTAIFASTIILEEHPRYYIRDGLKTMHLKEKIDEFLRTIEPENKNTLIYCSRNSKDAKYGRNPDEKNEKEIVDLLRNFVQNNTYYELVIYNGTINGTTMSFKEQIKLFNSAKIIVGPHGGAFANTIFIDPNNNCSICEFTDGPKSIIHGNRPFIKSYNFLYGGIFKHFAHYYLIPYDEKSTRKIVSIDIKHLEVFLTKIPRGEK